MHKKLYISNIVLEIYNINSFIMKKNRKTFLIASILIMGSFWGFIAFEKYAQIFRGLNLVIFMLIIILAGIALFNAIKKDREEKKGLATEDELSTRLKHKSGYYAYLSSMYMWLFIFLFKINFLMWRQC